MGKYTEWERLFEAVIRGVTIFYTLLKFPNLREGAGDRNH